MDSEPPPSATNGDGHRRGRSSSCQVPFFRAVSTVEGFIAGTNQAAMGASATVVRLSATSYASATSPVIPFVRRTH
jgi:hypothetical protein